MFKNSKKLKHFRISSKLVKTGFGNGSNNSRKIETLKKLLKLVKIL